MGNCRSSVASEGVAADAADIAPSQQGQGARLRGPIIVDRVAEEPQSQTRVDGAEADWQQGAEADDLWRESENASMSSCPMGPRNGTNMYESPLVLGRYSSMFPAADDWKASPKRSSYETQVRDTDVSSIQPANVSSESINLLGANSAADGPLRHLIQASVPDAHEVPVAGKTVPHDADSVCSQNSGSGPLNADRTMTFHSTSTGHFEAVRSWLVTVDSTSDMISSERTESLNEIPFVDDAVVR